MINNALLKLGIKSNYKTVIIFMSILTIYIVSIISMYDPKALSLLEGFTKEMPELMSLFGMNGNTSNLIGFLITYLYGFLFLLLPLIVTIMITNKLIVSHVDKGSMSYLLSSPNNRKKIILTQLLVINWIIFIIILYCTLLTGFFSHILFPNQLDLIKFIVLNLHLFIFQLFLSSICFLFSVIFNETKYYFIFGAGIPLFFYIIEMLANIGGKLKNFQYFTIYSLFKPLKIINESNYNILHLSILIIMIFSMNVISVKIFQTKNLPI